MTPLQKLPNNVGDLGKLIVAKGYKMLPKVQLIAQSGHTATYLPMLVRLLTSMKRLYGSNETTYLPNPDQV